MEHASTSTIDGLVPPSKLSSRSDQIRYAFATAAVGLAIGGLFVLTADLDSNWWQLLINGSFLGIVFGAQHWVEYASETTPRHAKRRSNIGFAGSIATALFVALPVLNSSTQSQEPSAPQLTLAVTAIALPTLVAAVMIARLER